MDIAQYLDLKLLPTLLLSAAGAGLIYRLKALPKQLWSFYLRHFTSVLTVDEACEGFFFLDHWLYKQPFTEKALSLNLENNGIKERWLTTKAEDKRLSKDTQFSWRVTVGFGVHWFIHNRTIYSYTKGNVIGPASETTQKPTKQITLRAYRPNRNLLIDIVENTQREILESFDGIRVRVWHSNHWRTTAHITPRNLSTIVLPKGQLERICADLEWYLRSADWYRERGIARRRGYLFSGPPGTGKTSLIGALAGRYRADIYFISLTSLQGDKDLDEALSYVAPNSFIVLEDIDAAGSTVKQRATGEIIDDGKPKHVAEAPKTDKYTVSLAGLLNSLDGVRTPEDVCFFLTTNHPEKLDGALLRPGRVDLHERLHLLGKEDQCKMADLFYGENNEFKGVDAPVSPARLQKAFMIHRDDPNAAREFIEQELLAA